MSDGTAVAEPGNRRFVVSVADLLRRVGSRRKERFVVQIGNVAVSSARLPDGVDVVADLLLEWVLDGILVSGQVVSPWEGECCRCLGLARGEVRADVRELFESRPREGESYPLIRDSINLEPLVRDALVLGLPLAPLCMPECLGLCVTCGANRNRSPCDCPAAAVDVRWAALDQLLTDPLSESD